MGAYLDGLGNEQLICAPGVDHLLVVDARQVGPEQGVGLGGDAEHPLTYPGLATPRGQQGD